MKSFNHALKKTPWKFQLRWLITSHGIIWVLLFIHDINCRDNSVYAPSQWEMALHCSAISHWPCTQPMRDGVTGPCNAVSYWLGTYTEWSVELDAGITYLSLTHWGRVTHICVGKLTNIGSDNGLSPGWRQAINWTNAGILLIGHLGTNFSEILIEVVTFSFKKMRLKVSSAKWRPFCLGLNVLRGWHGKS